MMKHKSKILKNFKLGDFILILCLIVLSFLPPYFFLKKHYHYQNVKTSTQDKNQVVAIVRINNKRVKTFNLSSNSHLTWTYDEHHQKNVIEVQNHRIRIKEANCKDQVCVKQGWKYKPGQTIICLPHKLLIELKSNNSSHTQDKESSQDFDNTMVNP